MNSLRSALGAYVAMRRGFGFKFRSHQEKRLTSFVQFMEQRDASIITRQLALEWAMMPAERFPTWALRLTDVRGFARHLRSIEPRTEVPETGLLPTARRSKPYIYSDEEIRRLLAAALALPPADGLRRWTYHCLFGLLAVTGLRISEVLALQCEDVDLGHGILTVRDTKFGKSRLVPLHPTTRRALLRYARRRDAHLRRPSSPYFFVADRGGQLLLQYVHPVFWRLGRASRPIGSHRAPPA